MAALDFPASPVNGQKYPQPPVAGQPVYTWDGEKWTTLGDAVTGKVPIYTDGSQAMTQQLTLVAPPVNPTDAAAKSYVDGRSTPATAAEYLANAASRVLTPNAVWAAAIAVVASPTPWTPDFNAGIDFLWQLTSANCQINNPANFKAGQKGIFTLAQDATGSRLITTWGSAYKFSNGIKPILSTAANAVDIISYFAAGSPAAPVMYCFFTPNMS